MGRRKLCYECGVQGEYELRETIRKYEGEGYCFEIAVKVPFCQVCGAPIYDEEIEQGIAERANRIIREQRQIITREEILEILKKYGLSQKYLSRLLGWGEITLTRYIQGNYTPNKANSDRLKGLKNPYLFQKLLDENSEKTNGLIEEEKSFQKAQRQVDEALGELEGYYGKIFAVVHWFLSQSSEEAPITHLALQKLLYFVQCWSLALSQKAIFEEECQAWAHGAVYPQVYQFFKPFQYKPLPKVKKETSFSGEELEILNAVKVFYYDIYNARALERICHFEEPYKKARIGCHEGEACKKKIEKQEIKDYYGRISRNYKITLGNMPKIQSYLNTVVSQ